MLNQKLFFIVILTYYNTITSATTSSPLIENLTLNSIPISNTNDQYAYAQFVLGACVGFVIGIIVAITYLIHRINSDEDEIRKLSRHAYDIEWSVKTLSGICVMMVAMTIHSILRICLYPFVWVYEFTCKRD